MCAVLEHTLLGQGLPLFKSPEDMRVRASWVIDEQQGAADALGRTYLQAAAS